MSRRDPLVEKIRPPDYSIDIRQIDAAILCTHKGLWFFRSSFPSHSAVFVSHLVILPDIALNLPYHPFILVDMMKFAFLATAAAAAATAVPTASNFSLVSQRLFHEIPINIWLFTVPVTRRSKASSPLPTQGLSASPPARSTTSYPWARRTRPARTSTARSTTGSPIFAQLGCAGLPIVSIILLRRSQPAAPMYSMRSRLTSPRGVPMCLTRRSSLLTRRTSLLTATHCASKSESIPTSIATPKLTSP